MQARSPLGGFVRKGRLSKVRWYFRVGWEEPIGAESLGTRTPATRSWYRRMKAHLVGWRRRPQVRLFPMTGPHWTAQALGGETLKCESAALRGRARNHLGDG